jgi:hypothetical protein
MMMAGRYGVVIGGNRLKIQTEAEKIMERTNKTR